MKELRKIMRKKMVTYLCYVIMMLSSVLVFSLEIEPPEPPILQQPPPPGLPIDGGISIFLIVGAVYGVYALKKNKNGAIKRLKG